MQDHIPNGKPGYIGPDHTPWSARWTDQHEREAFQRVSKEYFDHFKDMRKENLRGNVEYGRWLVATMVAVHGGALYALNVIRGTSPTLSPDKLAFLIEAASWHITGIVLIMIAGFMGWLNFGFAAALYDRWANPEMLNRLDRWPRNEDKTDPIAATYWLALCAGIGSGFSLVVGAIAVVKAITPT